MKKDLLIIIILIMTFVTGCKGQKKENEKEIPEKEEITLSESLFDEDGFCSKPISMGFGYENNHNKGFENKNNKITTEIWFESGDYELEIGILVFTNGILQPVSVEGEEEKTFNIYKVNGNTKTTYNIAFDIVSGNEGEMVRIDTISLLNPNFKITEKTKEFGLCFASSSLLPCWTECHILTEAEDGAQSFELTELSDEVKEKYIITGADGTIRNNLDSSMNIQYFQDGKEASKLIVKDNILEFNMDIYGGNGEKYNLYVFLNNEPLRCFDGKEYNNVTVTSEKTTKVTAKADLSGKDIGDYTQLFTVVVPVDEVKDSDTEVYKLSNIVVDNSWQGEEK